MCICEKSRFIDFAQRTSVNRVNRNISQNDIIWKFYA